MWEYPEIYGWSFAADRINIKVGSLLERNQTSFKAFTQAGSEICHFVGEYVQRLLQKE